MTTGTGGEHAWSDGSTKSDLNEARSQIVAEMRLGFAQTHGRLDTINGRVGKAEIDVARQDIRLGNVEKEVFDRRQTARRQESGESDRTPIRRRDVKLVVLGGAGLIAAIKFLAWIAPALGSLIP